MNIIDWFDIKNVDHLKAWKYLEDNGGIWEQGFIPNDVEFSPNWQFVIMSKMATAYVDLLYKEII